jgi:NADH-quinone oxidoreductase subunit N
VEQILPFAPAMFGVAGAVLAMVFDAWDSRVSALVAAVALLAAGAVAAGWTALATGMAGEALRSGGAFSVAPAVCLLLGAAALVGCSGSLVSDRTGSRIVALGALAASASALVAASADAGMLFLSVEMLALCGYGLVALGGTDRAREAAMKWFVQGSVATVVLVLGTAVLLGRTGGSLRYEAIAALAATSLDGPMAVGFVLVISALAFKLGAFPLHSWMPDAYETAPPAAAAIMASAGKVGPIAATVWLSLAVAGAAGERLIRVVAVLALCSIVFGNLAALRQGSLARMLAYSGIAQVGYALVGVPMGVRSASVLVFAVLYGLTAAASFVLVEAIHRFDPSWDGTIRGLAGLSRRSPALAASLAVIMFSLTGIPLTAGFWGKFLIFAGASVGGYLWLAIAGVLGSVISFGYYGAAIRSAYIDEPREPEVVGSVARPTAAHSRISVVTVSVLAVLIVIVGAAPMVSGLAPVLNALLK